MVSRKDLDSAELWKPWGVSKSPTTEQKRKGNSVCQRSGFIRDCNAYWRHTGSSSHSENSAKITGITTIGPVVRNHISSKMVGRSIAIRRTAFHSLSLICRQALKTHLHLLLLHLHRRTPWHPRSIQHHQEVRVWVRMYEETRRMICQNG